MLAQIIISAEPVGLVTIWNIGSEKPAYTSTCPAKSVLR